MSQGIQVINFNASTMHMLGKTEMAFKGGSAEVLVVAKMAGPVGAAEGGNKSVEEVGTSDARFYLSPMIAQTAFEDLTKGNKMMPVFEGRTATEMQEHLIKNAK